MAKVSRVKPQLPDDQVIDADTCILMGVEFRRLSGVRYTTDYVEVTRRIVSKEVTRKQALRELLTTDLWSVVYFVCRVPAEVANHKFWTSACRDVENGPRSDTCDLWARGHGKSSIITIAESLQDVMRDKEETIAIMSYARAPAQRFLLSIKQTIENNPFLPEIFPEIFWSRPEREAPAWSITSGLFCKRNGMRGEPTFGAYGLIDGMPTGGHFSKIVYDDIMTQDMANTPEVIEKTKRLFVISRNLLSRGGRRRIIGTPYHHEDVLAYVRSLKKVDGEPAYMVRLKPSTHNGESNGVPVYLSEEEHEALKLDRAAFNSQQLLNPSPESDLRMNPNGLQEVLESDVPKGLYKFILVDSAGDGGWRERARKRADDWAVWLVGVQPYRDDLGASNIYVLDGFVEPLLLTDAIKKIVDLYMRSGKVLKLCVEKVGMSTMEVHISNALRAKNKLVTVESGTLGLLSPGGRVKQSRIEQQLAWPLNNNKVHISRKVPQEFRERLREEIRRFPFWRDDGIDALGYIYDVVKDYRFPAFPSGEEREAKRPDAWADMRESNVKSWVKNGWLYQ